MTALQKQKVVEIIIFILHQRFQQHNSLLKLFRLLTRRGYKVFWAQLVHHKGDDNDDEDDDVDKLNNTKGIKVGNMAGCAALCFEDSKCKFWTYNPR